MLMVNTLLRDTKDTLLVTSKAGVEAIPILKSWLVIPCSVLFFLLYSKITSKFTKRKAFVIVLSLFVGFYLSFGIFLYPLKHYVSLGDGAKAWLESVLPRTFGPAFVALIDEWPLALFFVVSELWSSGVCQLMFWQVANDVMTVRQAKAYYPAIGAMGNLGMVVAGHFLMVFANQRDLVSAKAYLRITDNVKKHGDKRTLQQTLVNDLTVSERHPVFSPDSIIGHAVKVEHLNDPIEQGWSQTLAGIALMTLSSSVVIAMCYDSVYRRSRRPSIEIVNVDKQADILESGVDKKKKSNENKKPTKYFEGMRTLFQSKPLQCVAILVISYGVSSCLVEVCWKGQVKQAYPHPNDYSRFMAQFWFWTGAVSMIFMVMGRIVLEKLGYKFAILFTPIVMILAGSVFFLVALFQYFYEESMIPYAAYSGGFLVMIAKSAKYAFFDSTKEMMFIPLDQGMKIFSLISSLNMYFSRIKKRWQSSYRIGCLQASQVRWKLLPSTHNFSLGIDYVWSRYHSNCSRLLFHNVVVDHICIQWILNHGFVSGKEFSSPIVVSKELKLVHGNETEVEDSANDWSDNVNFDFSYVYFTCYCGFRFTRHNYIQKNATFISQQWSFVVFHILLHLLVSKYTAWARGL